MIRTCINEFHKGKGLLKKSVTDIHLSKNSARILSSKSVLASYVVDNESDTKRRNIHYLKNSTNISTSKGIPKLSTINLNRHYHRSFNTFGVRNFSSTTVACSPVNGNDFGDANNNDNMDNFTDSTVFESNDTISSQLTTNSSTISSESLSMENIEVFHPTWYNPVDHLINLLNFLDSLHDLPFALTVIGTTAAIRITMFPLFVKAQQNASRIAHMRPEMEALQARHMKVMGSMTPEKQLQFNQEMVALYKKYDCNPLKAIVVPLAQAPVLMSMFFGLQKMPTYFPELFANGGLFWFPDLAIPDPIYALPIIAGITFLANIEIAKKNMTATANSKQASMMIFVFRGLAVMMIPIAINFPSSVLCYWITNNTITVCQTLIFQNKAIRDALGIWELPKPVPGAPEPKGFREMMEEIKKNKEQLDNAFKKAEDQKKTQKQMNEVDDGKIIEPEFTEKDSKNDDNKR